MVMRSHEFSRSSQENNSDLMLRSSASRQWPTCAASRSMGVLGVLHLMFSQNGTLGHASRRAISRQRPTDGAPQHEGGVCWQRLELDRVPREHVGGALERRERGAERALELLVELLR